MEGSATPASKIDEFVLRTQDVNFGIVRRATTPECAVVVRRARI